MCRHDTAVRAVPGVHAGHHAPDGLIPLTCNEIQKLLTTLVVQPTRDVAHRLAWRY